MKNGLNNETEFFLLMTAIVNVLKTIRYFRITKENIRIFQV